MEEQRPGGKRDCALSRYGDFARTMETRSRQKRSDLPDSRDKNCTRAEGPFGRMVQTVDSQLWTIGKTTFKVLFFFFFRTPFKVLKKLQKSQKRATYSGPLNGEKPLTTEKSL